MGFLEIFLVSCFCEVDFEKVYFLNLFDFGLTFWGLFWGLLVDFLETFGTPKGSVQALLIANPTKGWSTGTHQTELKKSGLLVGPKYNLLVKGQKKKNCDDTTQRLFFDPWPRHGPWPSKCSKDGISKTGQLYKKTEPISSEVLLALFLRIPRLGRIAFSSQLLLLQDTALFSRVFYRFQVVV